MRGFRLFPPRICGIFTGRLTESDIGLAASLHLFAFLRSPYATGSTIQVRAGVAEVPSGPGLGIDIDEGIVRELAR
jgi:muconate cycloisomerase